MVVINDNQHKFIPNLNAIEFCKIYSVKIPTLCYLKEFNHRAKCGFCLIKVNGKIVLACNTIIKKNDIIVTNDQQLIAVRKNILININKRYSASIKQNHRFSQLLNEYQIETRTNNGLVKKITNNKPFNLIPNKCIGCGRCISICKSCVYNNQPCLKLDKNQRVSFVKKNWKNSKCILCGQCSLYCPTNAISVDHDEINEIKKLLSNKDDINVAIVAPSTRAALGEEFNHNYGLDVTRKIYTSLRKLGFEYIFDVNYGADMTVMEESCELLNHLQIPPIQNNRYGFKLQMTKKKNTPLFTSCCPGWVNLVKHQFPKILNNISTTKSPIQILASAIQVYLPKNINTNKKINIISITPCVAKKYEPTLFKNDVKISITTRQFADWLKDENIDLLKLKDGNADRLMGTYSGGGVIFGNSGGVCLATIRNLYRLLGIKNDFNKIKFVPMKKNQGLECSIKINQRTIKAAIISGAINVIKFIISKQYLNYDFIEIMACRGGCINGGGQPINDGQINLSELLKQRAEVLNTQDQKQIIARGRCSYDNDELLNFYLKMKITPNDKIAHKILHHHYSKND